MGMARIARRADGKDRRRAATCARSAASCTRSTLDGKASKLPSWAARRDAVWRQLCGYALERKKGDAEAARKFALAQYKNLYRAGRTPSSTNERRAADPRLVSKVKSSSSLGEPAGGVTFLDFAEPRPPHRAPRRGPLGPREDDDKPKKRNGSYKFLGDVGFVQNHATMDRGRDVEGRRESRDIDKAALRAA
jgi:hypothetical protein